MRREAFYIAITAVVIVLGLLAYIYSLNTPSIVPPSASQATIVSFTKLAEGKQSDVSMRVNYLVTSPSELQELWKVIGATTTPPAVDFTTHAVLAVFAGQEPEAAITVAKVQDAAQRLVTVVIQRPEESCIRKSRVTSPYEIVVVPTTSLPVTHEDTVSTTPCSN